MLKRFSNIALLVFCGLLVAGIVITREVDTAIETNENRKDAARDAIVDFSVDCTGPVKVLITADTALWVRIEYILPSFSSYNLDKRNGSWFLGEMPTNREATNRYLGKIASAKSNCSIVHSNPNALKMADYKIKVITVDDDTFFYQTYVIDTNFIVQDYTGQLYSGNNDSLFWQLYFGKQRFIPELAGQ